ncbi:g5181 [Coccomyxa viridis]|uniref:G5181 protein n=1 Tax=Coccomyxa viridis TaxID=1274662 RepID=A0ABP1FV05_9CHLO
MANGTTPQGASTAFQAAASTPPDTQEDEARPLPTNGFNRHSSNAPSPQRRLLKQASSVGYLCRALPQYVQRPPIEAVVFGWGVNEDGQLGLDTGNDVLAPKVVEALLGTRFQGRDFLRGPLVCGSRCTVAIDSDGQVLSWGWNARATLGHGHRNDEKKPRRIAALRGIEIQQISTGGWHCLALDSAGLVYAWGGNEYGQCHVEWAVRDVVEPTPCVPGLRIKQVSAGGMHSCVLTDTGEVWTWGEPWGDFSMKVDRSPKSVAGATDIVKIACGAFHNLCLNAAGEVLAWGINDFGQLGNGSTFYETSPTKVVGLESVRIADIAAGGWHSLALTTEGEVFVWGRGEYGRLGLGDRSGSSKLRATEVHFREPETRIVQASCGGTHTMVLSSEGRIFVWGRGSFGRLGSGTEKDHYSPVEVFLPGGPDRWRVICCAAGGRHNLVLAMPDNSDSDRAARSHSNTGLRKPRGSSEDNDELEGASDGEVGADLDDCEDHEEDLEMTAAAAGEDTQQHHGNSLASRRDWQELESGRSMEEHTLAAAAPPAPAAIRAWGLVDGDAGSPEGGSPNFAEASTGHGRNAAYTSTMPPDG